MRRLTRVALILSLLFILTAAGALGFLAITVVCMGDIPDVQSPQTSTFYDQNNEPVTTRFEQNRFAVTLEQVPDSVKQGFIAVEDHRFYSHHGIDIQGLMRAVVRNLREWRFAEGGSTITQQLARNLFLSQEKTITRKIQEMLLTIQLERKFTKDEILEKYLNTIYFGHSAYGVEAASRTYFGKSVGDLSLAEAAIIAGIPRGPAYYSPRINFDAAKKRQSAVLSRLLDQGYITEAERDAALTAELVVLQRGDDSAARQLGAYFIDYLIQVELAALFPEDPQIAYRGGLHVYTTLNKQMQQAAETVVANEELLPRTLVNDEGETVPLEVALVALDPADGSVRALVGGRDFQASQLNMAMRGRSPGSAFKPFTFAAALEAGFTPATLRVSEAITFQEAGQEPWSPTEYNNRFYGPLRFRTAIARSSNIVSVIAHDEIGRDKTVAMAQRLGITSPLKTNLALPLGTSEVTPLEMAAAYAPFANQGIRVEPRFITRITDASGRVLYQSEATRQLVLEARIAYLMTDMMKSVMQPGGTGASLALARPSAGKTGTSQGHRNSYMVGYTPDLVTSVWVGNLKNLKLPTGQTGAVRAGRVWSAFMRSALQNVPSRDFTRPSGIVDINICPETGLLHNPRCSLQPLRELFIAGTEPTEQCSWPTCPHCPPEPQWNWDGGWWFRRPAEQQNPIEEPEVLPPADDLPPEWNQEVIDTLNTTI